MLYPRVTETRRAGAVFELLPGANQGAPSSIGRDPGLEAELAPDGSGQAEVHVLRPRLAGSAGWNQRAAA
jgi:hypothetical protein